MFTWYGYNCQLYICPRYTHYWGWRSSSSACGSILVGLWCVSPELVGGCVPDTCGRIVRKRIVGTHLSLSLPHSLCRVVSGVYLGSLVAL